MSADDDSVADERGDLLETVFWGLVFLFTVALFAYEFGQGVVVPEEEGLLPIAVIVDFEQSMMLSALIGGGGVVALITYAIFRYSAGVRDSPETMRPGQGRFKLAVFTLAVLMIMSTTIFVGAATLAQTDEATPADAARQHDVPRKLHMDVTAAQWFWRFDVDGIDHTQAERVVLPADSLIVFETTSADVIHSFSIKELGITKDAIPGQTNTAWFYAGHVEGETSLDVEGEAVPADTYEVRCAELCGKGHSQMIATIYVVSVEDYEHWAQSTGGEAAFEDTVAAGAGHGHGEESEESGDHSESEGGDHDESGTGDHSESESGDHSESESGDHSESESGDHSESESGDHTETTTDQHSESDGHNESESDGGHGH